MTLLALLLVALLGHTRWSVREAANGALARIADYCPDVLFIAEKSADPEIAARVRPLTDKWLRDHAREILARELPTNWDRVPWICLYACDDYLAWVNAAQRPGRWQGEQDWLQWREAAENWLIVQVCRRRPVRGLIEMLCDQERLWRRDRGEEMPPVPLWR
jgi:hypothetical protein